MPTVLRVGPYRCFFYTGDREEPKHVHVERDDHVAKFWLNPVVMEKTGGLGRADIGRILEIVEAHQEELMEAWNEHLQG